MARGHKKDGLEILVWEIFRGTGRQTGRQISKAAGKQLKKKVLDDSSKFRNDMDRDWETSQTKISKPSFL